MFGVSGSAVCEIKAGRTWKNVDKPVDTNHLLDSKGD